MLTDQRIILCPCLLFCCSISWLFETREKLWSVNCFLWENPDEGIFFHSILFGKMWDVFLIQRFQNWNNESCMNIFETIAFWMHLLLEMDLLIEVYKTWSVLSKFNGFSKIKYQFQFSIDDHGSKKQSLRIFQFVYDFFFWPHVFFLMARQSDIHSILTCSSFFDQTLEGFIQWR